MKKLTLTLIISFGYITTALSQADGGISGLIVMLSQRSTVLYSDTVFEVNGLQFKVTETYAFRNKIKTTLILTNLTDQFKEIHSEDLAITDSEKNAIVINHKKPMVIAPKSSKKFGLMAESKTFKLYDIKISLKQIYTTTGAVTLPAPNLFSLRLEGGLSVKAGPLEITPLKCSGATKAYFKLSYTGDQFLGIHGDKARLLTADKKTYFNSAKKSKLTFYPKDKSAYTLLLEFENPVPNFEGDYCDRLSFENVFTEYTLTSDNKPIEFHVYKNGLANGDDPKEKKEKDAEGAED